MKEKINIAIIDKHVLFNEAVRSFFKTQPKFSLLTQASSCKRFCSTLKGKIPDVLLLIHATDTAEVSKTLEKKYPSLRIILPDYQDLRIDRYIKRRAMIHRTIKQDADVIGEYVTTTLHAVGNYLSEQLLKSMIAEVLNQTPRRMPSERLLLSVREQQVVSLITIGYTTKEIAAILHIMPSSIHTLRKRIITKIEGRTKSDIIAFGLKHKLDRKFGYGRLKRVKKAA